MARKKGKKNRKNQPFSIKVTEWIGTPNSLLLHSILFILALSLVYFGFEAERVMLVLTTIVSLEAIYLAIFIQMTVNKNIRSLEGVEEDIEEIQEDVEDLTEDIEKLGEELDEDSEKEEVIDKNIHTSLEKLGMNLEQVLQEIEKMKTRNLK